MYKANYNLEKLNLFDKSVKIVQKRGLNYLFKKLFYLYLFKYYYKQFLQNKHFIFKGMKFKYFFHPYNYTYSNERTIEVPLILSVINQCTEHKILEVGNVLSHYVNSNWHILDKFEIDKNIINYDVIDYKPHSKYDLIISISTLEHVGFDEEVKDEKKILKAIDNLKRNCLNKNGKIVFTIPVGWNANLDNMILQNVIQLEEAYYFKRVNWKNEWEQSNKNAVLKTKFAKPYIGANGIVLGVISN